MPISPLPFFHFLPSICRVLICTVVAALLCSPPLLFAELRITKIEIAEERIELGETQLIELHIRNLGQQTRVVGTRVEIHTPEETTISVGGGRVKVPPGEEGSTIIPIKKQITLGGNYRVQGVLSDSKERTIFSSPEAEHALFVVVDHKQTSNQVPLQSIINLNEISEDEGFAAPDLLVSEISISRTEILRGESSSVLLTISNQGGDIVKNVQWELYMVLEFLLGRKGGDMISKGNIELLSPGESKFLEIPVLLDSRYQTGRYFAEGVVDPGRFIPDTKLENNRKRTSNWINFYDIALVYPQENDNIAANSDLTFRWRSTKHTEFFIEISSDKNFKSADTIFQLPLGDPVQDTTITALSAEKKIGLLRIGGGNTNQTFYWRVKGIGTGEFFVYSPVRAFFVNRKL